MRFAKPVDSLTMRAEHAALRDLYVASRRFARHSTALRRAGAIVERSLQAVDAGGKPGSLTARIDEATPGDQAAIRLAAAIKVARLVVHEEIARRRYERKGN